MIQQKTDMHLQENFTFIIIDLNSGRYVKTRKGHEQFNFDNVKGKYFGYCPPYKGIDIVDIPIIAPVVKTNYRSLL